MNYENDSIKITAVFREQVTVDMAEVIKNIKEKMGFNCVYGEHFTVKDGVLLHGEDISRHGSPEYEYTEVSNNPNYINIFKSLNLLEDYFKDRDAPKWAKHIDVSPEKEKTSIKKSLSDVPKQNRTQIKNKDKGAR